ncbi:MAG: M1 family aminopeptidase [Candidatus Krumholzibacteriia bacterium]
MRIHRAVFTRQRVWSGLLVFLAWTIAALSSPLAQEKAPREFRRELAENKAERLATMYFAEAAQTPNQLSYDVRYYNLDLDIDPVTQTVSGAVTMTAEVTSDSLTVADMDLLANMTVTGAGWTGGPLGFVRAGDIVTVTLPGTYYLGETFTIDVAYNGTPSASYGAFGFDTHAGNPMIWSLSEPFGARTWWPCKDVPSDKADSVDISITVPNTLVVASNGTLVSETDNGTTRTYQWHEGYPIATYLVSVAIHPYTTFSHWYHHSPTDSMEVKYYVFPDHFSIVQPTYGLTVGMIELFANIFGEYPFLDEKYGHAEFVWGGGMEHQTLTSLGGWSEYLIVHELAHQWWGDMVTCDEFHHIWLNEGFATYSEALWSEATYGTAQYHQDMDLAKYFGSGTIYVPDTSNWGRVFHSGLSYNKASWVLHMLRHVVGDSTFSQTLQTYYGDPRYQYGTATTEQFRDLCEAVSGMDLDWFFHEWIYEEYYPTYAYNWSWAPNGGAYDIGLDIDQLQTNFIFKMPVDVTVQTVSGETTLAVWDSLAAQSFTLTVAEQPLAVSLDPEEWILRSVEEPVTNPSFDRGILVVNGVDFNVYGSEIWTAYGDSVFWGSQDISFWDCFDETGLGYPANLPPALGHGPVPPDTIKQFSTVVWVGNHYNGDLSRWHGTPIYSYLAVGGNVLLMTRKGQDFLSEPLREYLGITWRENADNVLNSWVAAYPGLVNMSRIGTQNLCAVFDTALVNTESTLLLEETTSFSTHRGLGVWRKPAGGGTHRSDGGQFVFISGRPYRLNHANLRDNVEFILSAFFQEPFIPTAIAAGAVPKPLRLAQNFPNPFNPVTTIRFSVPAKSRVTLRVYDVAGRLVETLLSGEVTAGAHTVTWDGSNRNGQAVASGVYFYRLSAPGRKLTRKMVLLQ